LDTPAGGGANTAPAERSEAGDQVMEQPARGTDVGVAPASVDCSTSDLRSYYVPVVHGLWSLHQGGSLVLPP
jgi:hypothetical protein